MQKTYKKYFALFVGNVKNSLFVFAKCTKKIPIILLFLHYTNPLICCII